MRIRAGIGDDQDARLAELFGDLIGKGTRGEPTSNGGGARVLRELEDRALAVGPRRNGDDVLGVLDGGLNTSGQHQLLPRLANINDVDAVLPSPPDIFLHHVVRVARADVALRREHLLDVLLLGGEDRHGGERPALSDR